MQTSLGLETGVVIAFDGQAEAVMIIGGHASDVFQGLRKVMAFLAHLHPARKPEAWRPGTKKRFSIANG